MIKFENNNITAITYNGYDIVKVYGECSDSPVWEKQQPTPPTPPEEYKLKMYFNDGTVGYLACDSTSSITVSEVQTTHTVYDGSGYVSEPYSAITAVTIGDCVKTIDTGAFSGMTNLERVNSYGMNVEKIGTFAFSGCTNLQAIYIGCETKVVDTGAFQDCESVSALNICSGVRTIGARAFRNITGYSGNVDIPDSVTSIGNYAFYNMPNVTNFIIRPTTPPTLASNSYAFHINQSTFPTAPLKVKVLSTYKVTGGWVAYDFCMQQL